MCNLKLNIGESKMASLRKPGKNYVVDFYIGKKKYIRSTKTSEYKIAKIILKDIENKIAKGIFNIEDITKSKNANIDDFKKEYLQYSKQHKAHKTFLRDRLSFKSFFKYVGLRNLDSIDQRMVESYLDSRLDEVSKSTINIELRHLKAAFNKAVQWNFAKKNPFKHVKEFTIAQKAPIFFTKEQIKKLLDHITNEDKWLEEIIIFAVNTGVRVGELVNIEWADIDFNRKIIKISQKKDFTTKSRRERVIPMNEEVFNLLATLRRNSSYVFGNNRGQRRSSERVSKTFKKYVRLSNIGEEYSMHVTRHTFASHLVQNGVSLYKVSKFLGHSDIKTTEIYAHLSPENLHSDVELLSFGGQGRASGLGVVRVTG
jgi:site-specific recombinase XerD